CPLHPPAAAGSSAEWSGASSARGTPRRSTRPATRPGGRTPSRPSGRSLPPGDAGGIPAPARARGGSGGGGRAGPAQAAGGGWGEGGGQASGRGIEGRGEVGAGRHARLPRESSDHGRLMFGPQRQFLEAGGRSGSLRRQNRAGGWVESGERLIGCDHDHGVG